MPTRGDPQLKVRLDSIVLHGLRAYVVAKGISKAELVRQIIMDWAREVSGGAHPHPRGAHPTSNQHLGHAPSASDTPKTEEQ